MTGSGEVGAVGVPGRAGGVVRPLVGERVPVVDAAGTVAGDGASRFPDFFIVGHPKCGTTALYEMLRSHPDIYMPDCKEPRFFAPDLRARFLRGAPRGEGPPPIPETLEEYLALFAPAAPGQRIGEASPSYLMSSTAAANIARVAPRARIVALLREPVSFLRSLQLELVQNHIERERDFRAAIAAEQLPALNEGRDDYVPPARRYSDRVRYVEQLRRYHAAFPAEQVLVLIYEDFRRENEATMRRVLRFLGVEETAPLRLLSANPTVRVRSLWLDRLFQSLYAGRGPLARGARRAVKALTPRALHGEGFRRIRGRLVYGRPRELDEAFVRELRARFKPEVLALSRYLDRDLVGEWGYDRIG